MGTRTKRHERPGMAVALVFDFITFLADKAIDGPRYLVVVEALAVCWYWLRVLPDSRFPHIETHVRHRRSAGLASASYTDAAVRLSDICALIVDAAGTCMLHWQSLAASNPTFSELCTDHPSFF